MTSETPGRKENVIQGQGHIRMRITLYCLPQFRLSLLAHYLYKYMRPNAAVQDNKVWLFKNCLRLKLYCRYFYTWPCMINHIWGLKQLWLQVNGHAWFHLQRLRWPVRNGEGAKNSKWKYMSPAGFEPTPCQSTTGKSQRLRPLGHEGLMVISGLMSNRIMEYKF